MHWELEALEFFFVFVFVYNVERGRCGLYRLVWLKTRRFMNIRYIHTAIVIQTKIIPSLWRVDIVIRLEHWTGNELLQQAKVRKLAVGQPRHLLCSDT